MSDGYGKTATNNTMQLEKNPTVLYVTETHPVYFWVCLSIRDWLEVNLKEAYIFRTWHDAVTGLFLASIVLMSEQCITKTKNHSPYTGFGPVTHAGADGELVPDLI